MCRMLRPDWQPGLRRGLSWPAGLIPSCRTALEAFARSSSSDAGSHFSFGWRCWESIHSCRMVTRMLRMVDRLKVDADLASDDCGGAGIVAGDRRDEIVTVRIAVIAVASLTAAAVAIAVTALSFDAVNWPVFDTANIMVALTYAAIGVIIGPLFGRLGGCPYCCCCPSSTSVSPKTRCSTPRHRPGGATYPPTLQCA